MAKHKRRQRPPTWALVAGDLDRLSLVDAAKAVAAAGAARLVAYAVRKRTAWWVLLVAGTAWVAHHLGLHVP